MTGPGIHDGMSADEYHADPTQDASLSAHLAHLLVSCSPRHAWSAHPKLNPDFDRVEEAKFDLGTVAHELVLRGVEVVRVVDAADWRTNAAKDERDQARAEGLVPLLAKDWKRVMAMCDAITEQLDALDIDPQPFTDGTPETTLIWQDSGVWARGRLDWLRSDRLAIDDLKTTQGSANPAAWCRARLWDIGADVQAAFYIRGLRALTGVTPDFRFVVAESSPPYAVSVVSLAPGALELANRKVDYAIATWKECIRTGVWPAYPRQVVYAELPAWAETDFFTRTFEERAA